MKSKRYGSKRRPRRRLISSQPYPIGYDAASVGGTSITADGETQTYEFTYNCKRAKPETETTGFIIEPDAGLGPFEIMVRNGIDELRKNNPPPQSASRRVADFLGAMIRLITRRK